MTTEAKTRIRAKPDDRRAQILDEATRLIGQRGYYGFGIRELSLRCQLTDAGLLHYFGSKAKLLTALLEDRDRRDAEIVAKQAGLADGRDQGAPIKLTQVVAVLREIVAHNSTQPELMRLFSVLQAEALNEGHPAHGFFLAREAKAIHAFTRMLAPHTQQPRSVARQVLATIDGLQQQWLRSEQSFDIITEWEVALSRLLPPPARRRKAASGAPEA